MRVIDLPAALAGLGFIALGLGGLFLAGRDSKADEHDLSDYKATVGNALEAIDAAEERAWHRGFDTARRYPRPMVLGPGATYTPIADDILPPAPEGMNAGSPLYAGMLFDTWFPESAEDTAARFLRELRDEALAGAR